MNVSLPCPLSVCVPCKFITTPHTPPPAKKQKSLSLLQGVAAHVGAIKRQEPGRAGEGRRGGGQQSQWMAQGRRGRRGRGRHIRTESRGREPWGVAAATPGEQGREEEAQTHPLHPPLSRGAFKSHGEKWKRGASASTGFRTNFFWPLKILQLWAEKACCSACERRHHVFLSMKCLEKRLSKCTQSWLKSLSVESSHKPPPPRSLFPLYVSQQEVECALQTEQIIHKVVILIPSLSY